MDELTELTPLANAERDCAEGATAAHMLLTLPGATEECREAIRRSIVATAWMVAQIVWSVRRMSCVVPSAGRHWSCA
jgi:hypothetical protein